jgi:hypothetical protein
LLALAVALAAVLAAAWLAARALGLSGLDRALAAGTLAVAVILGSTLFCGLVLSRLGRGDLLVTTLVLSLAVAAAALTVMRRRGIGLRDPGERLRAPSLRGLVAESPWAAALLALAGLEFLWRALVAYALPAYGYDALWYHLSAVDGWLARGSIGPDPLTTEANAYPMNVEVLVAWASGLLGSDGAVGFVQLGLAVLGSLAVAGIARRVGLRGASAVAAGSLFFITPTVLAQTSVVYVDVATTAFFLVGLYFLISFLDAPATRPALLGLAGLSAGFALGSKITGAVYAGVLAVLALVHLGAALRGRRISGRAAATALAVLLVPLIAAGGYWYARNLAEYGSPLYPAEVRIAGVELFQGPFDLEEVKQTAVPEQLESYPGPLRWIRSWGQDVLRLAHPGEFIAYDERLGGLGAQWLLLGAPLALLLAAWAARRDRSLLLNFLVPVAVVFVLAPLTWWARFTLVLCAAGAVAVAWFAERLPDARLRIALMVATLLLAIGSAWSATGKIVLGDGGVVSAGRVLELATSEQPSYGEEICPAFAWVDRLPAGATIGVDRSYWQLYHPLYGPRREHRPVPIAAAGPAELARHRYVFLPRGSRYERFTASRRMLYGDRLVAAYDMRAREDVPARRAAARRAPHPVGCNRPQRMPAAKYRALREVSAR